MLIFVTSKVFSYIVQYVYIHRRVLRPGEMIYVVLIRSNQEVKTHIRTHTSDRVRVNMMFISSFNKISDSYIMFIVLCFGVVNHLKTVVSVR